MGEERIEIDFDDPIFKTEEFKRESSYSRGKDRVPTHYIIRDYHRMLVKKGWESIGKVLHLDHTSRIITAVNRRLKEEFLRTGELKFPCDMGKLYIVRSDIYDIHHSMNDRIVKNRCIDWGKTRKLWYKYPELKEKRKLVLKDRRYKYEVKYELPKKKFKMQHFYRFVVRRDILKEVMKRIRDGEPIMVYER